MDIEKFSNSIFKNEFNGKFETIKNIIHKIYSLESFPSEEEINAIKSNIKNLPPGDLLNLFKVLKHIYDCVWEPKSENPLTPETQNLFKNFYNFCFYLTLNYVRARVYTDKELNFLLNATFEKNTVIPDEELEIIFENLSFFNKEIPEAVEPANFFKEFVEDVDFFTDLTHKVIYFAEFCIEKQKIKNAESALRYCYLYMRDIEYNEPYQSAYPELLEDLIHVSIMLGKNSQALRYLEELKDLYLKEEIPFEYYIEVLTKYGTRILQVDIKSISPDYNLIYELYNELKNLREENRKLNEILSEYQSPDETLKHFFGIFWDNLDEVSKQNLSKAKKAEILMKQNNEVFRDVILGYYDAVNCELQKLNQKITSTITTINIKKIDNEFKKFEAILFGNIKEIKDFLNKETIGGTQIIKNQYFNYIRPLSKMRNKLAHQTRELISQDEINKFLIDKLPGILKFIISIQPRPS